jgi:hypothetical protein
MHARSVKPGSRAEHVFSACGASVEIAKLLDDAIATLDGAGVTWAVMGGCARNAYAEPRATRDVDFVVEADSARFQALERALRSAGFERATTVDEPGELVPDLVLYRDAGGRRIDVLFAHTAFERSALSRRTTLSPLLGSKAHVVSPEDLVVYKLIADRPQDRADIAAVVEAQRARGIDLDWSYVEHWCDEWELTDRLAKTRLELGE